MHKTYLIVKGFLIVHALSISEVYKYDLIDDTSNSMYTEGGYEYHCFDISSGVKTYVRGTYGKFEIKINFCNINIVGRFGYFEGAVDLNDPYSFHINWYEATTLTLVPTSGSAVLNYSLSWDEVSGPYWAGGRGDISNSYDLWHSINGNIIMDDSTSDGSTYMLKNCLYPGLQHVDARKDLDLSSASFVSGTSDAGTNSLCRMPVGGGGAWLGTYKYIYGVVDDYSGIEEGSYGTEPFAFWVKSGMGFVGVWTAFSGPFDGNHGTNIYMVTSSDGSEVIVGYYCEVDDDDNRIDCYNEFYEQSESDSLSCPHSYQKDDSLDSLMEFADEGSTMRICEDKKGNRMGHGPPDMIAPIVLAVFFFCTTIALGVMLFIRRDAIQVRPTKE